MDFMDYSRFTSSVLAFKRIQVSEFYLILLVLGSSFLSISSFTDSTFLQHFELRLTQAIIQKPYSTFKIDIFSHFKFHHMGGYFAIKCCCNMLTLPSELQYFICAILQLQLLRSQSNLILL